MDYTLGDITPDYTLGDITMDYTLVDITPDYTLGDIGPDYTIGVTFRGRNILQDSPSKQTNEVNLFV